MKIPRIVVDTNVIICALRSNKGTAYKLIENFGSGKFDITISVPLILEYEDVAKRYIHYLTDKDVDDFLNYICTIGIKRKIYYLWRPFLKDPKDDMVLELAVESQSRYIVTFNEKDFHGSEKFGIGILNPVEFLRKVDLI
jgi:putative PIN family toxin of toxin-antitoxin system